ncbi:MAG TPA: hypothetical protein VNL16_19895 [Chloroflexota bacterium]|nr:hypothetical protein [Chloroflexota bacterium]
MRRLTESVAGIILLAATFVLGLAGLLADLTGQSDPPTLFGGAIVAGIAAIAVAHDEHRRTGAGAGHWTEALFGRVLVALALLLGVVALVLGLQGNADRSLWLVLAVVVALDGLAVIVDTRRLVVARDGSIETRSTTDAIPGAVAGAIGLGLAIVGFLAGLLNNPHAPAWLYFGVVCAVLSNAFMFDEHAHVAATARAGKAAAPRRSTLFSRVTIGGKRPGAGDDAATKQ